MKPIRFLTTCFLALVTATLTSASPYPQRLLLVGDKNEARLQEYVQFLRQEFREVKVAGLADFKRDSARDVDVVLVDWPQGGSIPRESSPLGPRDTWSKPTVLLGSAGLNLAVAWEMVGGSG